MSKEAIESIKAKFGDRVLGTSDFRGDDEALVAANAWLDVARFLKSDLAMDHITDITAVDYPEREPDLPRFDVLLLVRSMTSGKRVRIKTRVRDGEEIDSLISVWKGADWAEREVFDMFGIRFKGHPDLRRILLYPEFVGHPLRKDYPIDKTQPLVEYRTTGSDKLAPFDETEGHPWSRVNWQERLVGGDIQVSPAISVQTGQRKMLSQSEAVVPLEQQAPTTATVKG